MRRVAGVGMLALLLGVFGCGTSGGSSGLRLTESEWRELASPRDITLSESLRKRLIAGSQELRLTPEEMRVLKSTGKVILCGKCGYLLNSKQFKEHNDGDVREERDAMGFVKGSLRDRIFEMHID